MANASTTEAVLDARIQQMVLQWSQGRVSLHQMIGLSAAELHAISSQGYHFFLQGKAEEARIIFEGLVALDPRNSYYLRALGVIYWRLKDPERALAQFSYAMRVAPYEVSSYVNRAEVYIATQQYESAKKDLFHVLSIAHEHDAPLVRKAQAMLRMIGE